MTGLGRAVAVRDVSPKLATSTPISLSFVDRSAPVKVRVAPVRFAASTSAIS